MAALSSVSNSDLRFSGLASGIDSSKIIDGLTAINQQRIDAFQAQKGAIVQQQTAMAGIQGKLLDLQAKTGILARSIAGAFDGRKATSSDETILKAAAGTTAQTGTYTLEVKSLAQGQQILSNGLADANTNIKQGTLQISVGAGTTTTVTIGSANNTLQGLVNAINSSGSDVRATLVKDGSATPYRLLLTSSKTGAANTIQITNNLTTGTGADVSLTQTVQPALDAQVTIGTGSGALTVTSASNQVADLIGGVTLDLKSAAVGKPVTLTIENDIETATSSVKDLVDSYNNVIDFIDQRDNFDPATKEAGIFLGNRDVSDLQNDLQSVLTSSVPGLNSRSNNLSSIGVTFNEKGRLQFDSSKFEKAMNGQIPGVAVEDIRRLFALTGQSSSPGVSFVLGNDRTKATVGTPYQVDITQAATQAVVTGTNVLPTTSTITAANNEFYVKLNGLTSSLISIAPGDYTPSTLAAAIRAGINSNATLLGGQVSVDLDGMRLRIASQAFGSSSSFSFAGGSALGASGPLGFVGNEASTGVNVAGNFVVNGQIEAATGVGQILSGNSGNKNTDGLQVKSTLSSTELSSGPEANLTVTQGVASRLNQVLSRYVDPVSGRLKSIDDRYKRNISDIDQTITRQNDLLQSKKDQLIKQFADMESAVSRLKTMGDQITAQLGGAK